MSQKPATHFAFVHDWFTRAANGAQGQGRRDSELLWREGLAHLEDMRMRRDALRIALLRAMNLLTHGNTSEAKGVLLDAYKEDTEANRPS